MIWGFDTENNTDTGELLQFSATTDGKDFYHFTDCKKIIKWFQSNFPETTYFVACNLEYDLINVFAGRWDALDLRLKNHGQSIVSARLRGTKVYFYCTLNHFPFGVAAMGETLDLPKLKDDLTGWDYVDRDTWIVAKYCQEMQTRYNMIGTQFNATAPSSALELYRRKFLPFRVKKPLEKHLDKMFEGYYGGRVECFNVAPQTGRCFYIDVNSMYPAVMRSCYPNPNDYKLCKTMKLDEFGVSRVKIKIPADEYFPSLAFRKLDKAGKMEKLLFPVGTLVGVWTNDEIRFAVSRGASVISCDWSIRFGTPCYPFTDYVETLYPVKQHASDEIEKYVAKLFLNSLYGKMGERVYLTQFMPIEDVPPERTASIWGDYAFVELGRKIPEHTNAIWAIHTTALARLMLTKTMIDLRDKGATVLYCDTDSIVYRADEPLHVDSDELGDWKQEAELTFCHFLGPKFYAYIKKGEKARTFRAKGVPRCAFQFGDDKHDKKCCCTQMQYWDEGRATFRRPHRLRSVLKMDLGGGVWRDTGRERRAKYTKRRVIDNGDTVPLKLRMSKTV